MLHPQVTVADLSHFKSIVGNNMLTDIADIQPYNTDWLKSRQ